MFIGSFIVVSGVITISAAPDVGAYMAGRFLAGFGVAIARSAAPSYVTEISPPQWRGPATLLYNSLWLIGAILASAIAYTSGPMKSTLSWRLPLIIQVVPSMIVLLGCMFMPESPRWLIANDRHDEARRIIAKYHDAGDMDSGLVKLEMAEMDRSIRKEASDKRWYDYSDVWSSRSARYRTFMVVSMAFIGKYPLLCSEQASNNI
jgi:MFS family permease